MNHPVLSNAAIVTLSAAEARSLIPELAGLLQDAVNNGAALGFLAPLEAADARQYWLQVAEEVQGGHRVLLVARSPDQELWGTVQLDLASRPNGLHRAEVAKMMVHTRARRAGVGRRLLQALEKEARRLSRSTLVLDTREGDVSEQLYQKAGYQRAGLIPDYARSSDGSLHVTVLYYKLLAGESQDK